jgi:hypothetical protein
MMDIVTVARDDSVFNIDRFGDLKGGDTSRSNWKPTDFDQLGSNGTGAVARYWPGVDFALVRESSRLGADPCYGSLSKASSA